MQQGRLCVSDSGLLELGLVYASPGGRLRPGGVSEDDVPSRGQLADLRVLDRGEVQAEGLVALGVAAPDRLNCPSRSLPAYPLTKHSVVSSFLSPFQTCTWMCAAGRPAVGDRLDGPEVVLAGRAGQEAAESLEVRVELLLACVVRLEVGAVAVALPDLDDGVADRVALGVEDPAAQVRDLADRRGDRVVDDQQVVVGVERELGRVVRPLVLVRGAGQLLGEGASGREGGCASARCSYESSPVGREKMSNMELIFPGKGKREEGKYNRRPIQLPGPTRLAELEERGDHTRLPGSALLYGVTEDLCPGCGSRRARRP